MSPNGPQSTLVRVHRRRGRSLKSVVLQLSAAALSFILMALLVVTSSRAAFVAQNDNSGNQVTAATVVLSDDDSGSAMFADVQNLTPGNPHVRCIDVTYTGTADPLPVRLFATAAPTGALAAYLDLTVEMGTGSDGAFATCGSFVSSSTLYTGTLSAFGTTHGDYDAGRTTWDPTVGTSTRTFRFTVAVRNNVAAQGQTSTFGFSWETRTS
jgi:hypothetical protein